MTDNPALSQKPARRRRNPTPRESLDMAAFVRRLGRAMVRRATDGDILALVALLDMQADLDAAAADAARALVATGLTWADIGRDTGMTRQAARQRWSETA